MPGTQDPDLQASFWVQLDPSLHGAELKANTQPLRGSQLSSVHGLASPHCCSWPGLHLPWTHVSFTVQVLPSLQAALTGVLAQPLAGEQLSMVQALPSSQASAVPDLQLPALHTSP